MDHNILFVDDEENILKAMKRIFHRSPFNLFFAENGEEGLEIIRERPISVIISDMKMPGMNGVEFLKMAEDHSPDSIRIILSGYSDIEDILNAVNQGHVHNYITKPWENERLKIIVYNGTIGYEKNIKLKNLIDEIKDKNLELQNLNNDLEKTISRRTRELSVRNKILMNLMSESDAKKNIRFCLHEISQYLNGKKVYLTCNRTIDHEKEINIQDPPPKKIINSLTSIHAISYINDYLVIPVQEKEENPNFLIISPIEDETRKHIQEIVNLSTMIRLIIKQQQNLEKTKNLIESYDEIMEALDE
jgi:YesN/AraC family two-component response regulator